MITRNGKNFSLAIATMVGMTIGVGFFGVPYAIEQAGLFMGIFYFIILGIVTLFLHLMYGEVVLRTSGKHRFVGYVSKYLGKRWVGFANVTSNLGFYSALIAYIIVGGQFLFFLLSPILGWSLLTFQLVFFALLAVTIFAGLNIVSEVTTGLTILMIGLIVVLIGIALPRADFYLAPLFDKHNFFLPYGIILFALSGTPAIPEMRDILEKRLGRMYPAILWSVLVSIALTALFAFAVVGVGQGMVSEDAVSTLAKHFGAWVLIAGSIMGVLAVATSFLVLGLNLEEQFVYDSHRNKLIAFFFAMGIPLLAFLILPKDFISIIGFAGAVFTALDSALIVAVWRSSRVKSERKPEYTLRVPHWIGFAIIAMFALGAVYEIAQFFW